ISSTSAMPKRCGQNLANSSCGSPVVIKVTIRPMNTGTVESSSATTNPAANNAANRPFAWRAKRQKNTTKPGGGPHRSGDPGRPQQPLEEREHDTYSKGQRFRADATDCV